MSIGAEALIEEETGRAGGGGGEGEGMGGGGVQREGRW